MCMHLPPWEVMEKLVDGARQSWNQCCDAVEGQDTSIVQILRSIMVSTGSSKGFFRQRSMKNPLSQKVSRRNRCSKEHIYGPICTNSIQSRAALVGHLKDLDLIPAKLFCFRNYRNQTCWMFESVIIRFVTLKNFKKTNNNINCLCGGSKLIKH